MKYCFPPSTRTIENGKPKPGGGLFIGFRTSTRTIQTTSQRVRTASVFITTAYTRPIATTARRVPRASIFIAIATKRIGVIAADIVSVAGARGWIDEGAAFDLEIGFLSKGLRQLKKKKKSKKKNDGPGNKPRQGKHSFERWSVSGQEGD